jgi:3-mercaptopyruvate sulfurtransferase SseA
MKKKNYYVLCLIAVMVLSLFLTYGIQAEGADSAGVEISTEELKQILLAGKVPVIDVRPEKEYAISHIPGSVNIFETKVEEMMKVTRRPA